MSKKKKHETLSEIVMKEVKKLNKKAKKANKIKVVKIKIKKLKPKDFIGLYTANRKENENGT